ncbi:hypothetical protein K7H22_05030 [Seohaeicola saemankumensis]|uniref:hypothetical protein n=1 Tax=Seohaeicola saemankumensis TaxID=481181 RepID=UPI001E58C08E|nr:hypothetical protein [Seohaeicola saemankumensis]MCD1625357.1 hypothetical protein [Seohaeicola saemankumensis]
MAGNRQHHVWQLLQRGFGEKRGKDHHIWTYMKGVAPKRTVTRLFGFEKHFYGDKGSLADEVITDFENRMQSEVQEFRNLPHGSEIDSKTIASLIGHLETRTSFLRKDSSMRLQRLVGGWVKSSKSAEKLRKAMVSYLEDNPAELEKFFGKSFVPPDRREHYKSLVIWAIGKMPDDDIVRSMEGGIDKIFAISERFPDIIRQAQNEILSRSLDEEFRTQSHLDRRYHIFRSNLEKFILPDTTLAFVKKEGASPFSQKSDKIECVILPISSTVAIIGGSSDRQDYTVKTMNRILAGCAFEAFLAEERCQQFQSLTKRIGKYARLLSDNELRKLANFTY